MRAITRLAALALLAAAQFFAVQSVAAQPPKASDFVEGRHYLRVSPPQPTETADNIEVREFFWYGCPHCYVLEPYLDNWRAPEGAEFARTPATFNELWITHARVYFMLEGLGRLDDLHPVFFEALHQRKLRLNDPASLAAFFAGYDIPERKFRQAFQSLLVDTKVRRADARVKAYNLKSVPTFVVNGKYLTSPRMAGNYAKLMQLLNHLIERERNKP